MHENIARNVQMRQLLSMIVANGRGAGRLFRDQGVGGSNPLSPTILSLTI